MKFFKLFLVLFWLLACKQTDSQNTLDDKEEIQNLIRQVLNWSQPKSIELLPVLTDSKDSSCVGFDFNKLKSNIDKLKETNLFAEEFIENYNQIIQTLDQKIKSKEFEKWYPYGDLPPFSFANDVDPWCLCQDIPYEKPNPWDLVEVTVVNLNKEKGELYWKWGKLELNQGAGWNKFAYGFSVIKENGKWKINYMEGFDFDKSVQMDGK
jgi:hypothetical protein